MSCVFLGGCEAQVGQRLKRPVLFWDIARCVSAVAWADLEGDGGPSLRRTRLPVVDAREHLTLYFFITSFRSRPRVFPHSVFYVCAGPFTLQKTVVLYPSACSCGCHGIYWSRGEPRRGHPGMEAKLEARARLDCTIRLTSELARAFAPGSRRCVILRLVVDTRRYARCAAGRRGVGGRMAAIRRFWRGRRC